MPTLNTTAPEPAQYQRHEFSALFPEMTGERSREARAKFVDDVGFKDIWDVMTEPARDALRELALSNPGNDHARQVSRSDWNYSTAPNQFKRAVQ